MQIRAATPTDLTQLTDLDATVESNRYLHLERAGEGVTLGWRLEERPLRQKLIDPNPMSDENAFALKQVVAGTFEGAALAAEHEGALVALAIAQPDPVRRTVELLDLRVDFDYRRQGLATAMLFQIIQTARDREEARAVVARTRANNYPAAQLMLKAGFDLTGVDTHFHSNHDLVKEAVTLFWYAVLE